METPVLSLYELNGLVRGVVNDVFNDRFWVRAETSDVRVNQSGHCYLEFIEKDESKRGMVARARGSIWANVYRLLKAYFESETGQPFTSGLKVLVQVSVEFHELYGYSLNVHNIDPSYTLGDQARNRAMIIRQLEEEGVLTLNKELEIPPVLNRIAVISSPTAAGYEDFMNQLDNNADGFVFYTHLFPAVMQGDRAEESIIYALDRIYESAGLFDAVVIIRGGGASSELSCFDSYLLAANCAQFPLPVITGIGHERDDTVVDMVAHTRAKTPTAVAEFLIRSMQYTTTSLFNIQEELDRYSRQLLTDQSNLLDNLSSRFSYITKDMTKDLLNELSSYSIRLKNASRANLSEQISTYSAYSKHFSYAIKDVNREEQNRLELLSQRLKNVSQKRIREQIYILDNAAQYIKLVSPESILKKGYSLTTKEGKIVKSAADVISGDKLATRFFDGEIQSIVE